MNRSRITDVSVIQGVWTEPGRAGISPDEIQRYAAQRDSVVFGRRLRVEPVITGEHHANGSSETGVADRGLADHGGRRVVDDPDLPAAAGIALSEIVT
jgi:hypothetical protein